MTLSPEWATILYMSDQNQGTPDANQDRKGLLVIALDHAWRWYDFRYGQAAQLINFFTLWCYSVGCRNSVSAINAGHRGTATAIALQGILATATTYIIGTRLTGIARLAHEPLKEIEGELAEALGIDTMRLVERRESRHGFLSHSGAIANIMLITVSAACLAGAGLAWFAT